MSNSGISSSLNPQQREAVLTTEGAVLVLAGAGTGKTHTVTERIAHIIRQGTKPENILAVTFTNKAAGEMKERIAKRVGKRADLSKMIVSTFHSLCVRILRRDAELLGYRPEFTISDQGEQMSLIRKAAKNATGAGRVKPEDLLYEIGQLKSKGISPRQYALQAIDDHEHVLASVYRKYQESLKLLNAFDFDDLLIQTLTLLEKHESARSYWQDLFHYIMVDEFQDTSHTQCRLIEILTGKHGNLCVVGDDDQSIYSWRGAVADNILGFHKRFVGAKVIALEENYRSVMTILRASNAVIERNEKRHPKTLWSSLGEGDPVRVMVAEDQQNEAEMIVSEIKNRVMDGKDKPSEFAIILRMNAQTRPLEEELRTARLPYTIIGGSSFFDRKEVRDMLSYLTAIQHKNADGALLRILNVPARGIGDKSAEVLADYARQNNIHLSQALAKADQIDSLSPKSRDACLHFAGQLKHWRQTVREKGAASLVGTILNDIKYEDEVNHLYDDPLEQAARMNMAADVENSVRNYLEKEPDEGLTGFLQEAMLWGREDDKDAQKDAVRLITAHSAKGLEFPYVYVVGVENGIMPHKNSLETGQIDEERRLFYVALTRARRELTITRCDSRLQRGKPVKREPSCFLNDIPAELLQTMGRQARQEVARSAISSILANLDSQS